MTPGGRSLRRLAGSAGGKVGVAAAMLAAAAIVVVTAGGGGLFGPLGSLISGAGAQSAVERGDGAGVPGAPAGAIVAAGSASPLASSRRAPAGGPRGEARRPEGGRRVPRGPAPRVPGAPAPGVPGSSATPPGGRPPQPPPPAPRRVVDSVDEAVAEVSRQAPAPARPLTSEVERIVRAVTDTCRGVVVCP